MSGIIFTITGPSLSGKSTLEAMLVKDGTFAKAVSTTTRPQRQGEIDGAAYHFVSKEEFERREALGEMVESVEFDKNRYGVTKDEVQSKFTNGAAVVIVVEPNGARQIKAFAESQGWTCVQVLVTNPDEVLKERFKEREDADELADPKVYAQRWKSMKTVEKLWCEQMANAEFKFKRFDSTTQDAVVKTIKDKLAELRLANKAGMAEDKKLKMKM